MVENLSREKYPTFQVYPFGQIKWDTLPYGREKIVSSPLPPFNVAVVLSRTLTYMFTHNIDLGDGGRGKVVLPN